MKRKWLAVFAVCMAAGLVILFSRDTIVLCLGIRVYRRLLRLAVVLMAAGSGTMFVSVCKTARNRIGEKQQQQKIPVRQRSGELPMNGELSDVAVASLVRQQAEGRWRCLEDELVKVQAQLRDIDNYQDRLHSLLAANDAEKLNDTEEVLSQTEQYMLRKVRRILNYMSIYDPNKPDERQTMADHIGKCVDENKVLLGQTKEFVLAVTEFVNRQGESDNELELLQMCKDSILNYIGGA